jgi:nitroreductase
VTIGVASTELSLLDGLATTRAIRRYTAEPIPEHDLRNILWHATRAPTGSNRQNVRYLVLTMGERAAQAKALIGAAFRAGWDVKRITDGYVSADSAARPTAEGSSTPKARTAAAMQHYVDHFEQIPVVVLVCLIRHRRPHPSEGASVYPACQNLLLAARALGYGGVLTMWHQSVETELRTLLDIPNEAAVSACITLGRPAGGHGPVRRRPLADVVFDDSWGTSANWASDPPGTLHTSWK